MTSRPDPTGADQVPGYKSRRNARVAIEGKASLTPQNLYNVEVKVRDLSTSGFMAECAEPVRIGSYVSLDIPGVGPVHAQVRWQIGVKLGGMFLDPISLARCEWVAEKAEAA
jgi:PilZ domain